MPLRHVSIIRLRSLLLLLTGSLGTLFAYTAPRGEITPSVYASHGFFQVISYYNPGGGAKGHLLRTVYAPDGKVVIPKHRLGESALLKDWQPYVEERDPYAPYSFSPAEFGPANSDPFGSEPFSNQRLVFREIIEGVPRIMPLPLVMPELPAMDISYSSTPSHFAVLWSKPAEGEASGLLVLYLSWMRRDTFAEAKTRELGPAAGLWDWSSGTSRPVWAGSRLWVAWVHVQDAKEKEPKTVELMLSSYDPTSDTLESKPLKARVDWDSRVSLASTNGWLCLAWHVHVADETHGSARAEVLTAFEKLPSSP